MKQVHEVSGIKFVGARMAMTIDGRDYSWPLRRISARLARAEAREREEFEVSPSGYGIHWPLVDEDLSVDGLLRDAGEEVPQPEWPAQERKSAIVAESRARYGRRRASGRGSGRGSKRQ